MPSATRSRRIRARLIDAVDNKEGDPDVPGPVDIASPDTAEVAETEELCAIDDDDVTDAAAALVAIHAAAAPNGTREFVDSFFIIRFCSLSPALVLYSQFEGGLVAPARSSAGGRVDENVASTGRRGR